MKLATYDPVSVPMPPREVDEAQVKARANEIVSRIPCYADVEDQAVAADDKAKIVLTLAENGTPLSGLDDARITLSLADNFFPKPLSEGIAGMMPGESKRIEWKGAGMGAADETDTSSSFAADVKVLSVRKRVRPPMTDEWVAAHIPRCSTVEGFLDEVRRQMEGEADVRWKSTLRDRCAAVLATRLEGEPGDADVERSVAGTRRTLEQSLARQGKTLADKASEMGVSKEQLDELVRRQGEFVARQGAAVSLMADHLDIQVDGDDLERVVRDGMRDDPDARRLLSTEEGRARLAQAARCEKALDWVVEHAQVVDEPQAAGAEGTAPGFERPNPFE